MKKTNSPVEWASIVEAYRKTRSIRKTAIATGMSKTGVEYVLRQTGTARYPRTRKGEESSSVQALQRLEKTDSRVQVRDRDILERLYSIDRLSIPEISKKLSIGRTTVRNSLIRLSIPLRTRSQALRGKPRPKSRGENHRDWNGGVTHWRKICRERLNPVFVRPVLERDAFRCVWCLSVKKLVVHHIKAFSEIVKEVREKNPNLVGDAFVCAIVEAHRLEYGITLCKVCHDRHHTSERSHRTISP